MAEIPDGSTAAPNPSLPALIEAELARFAPRQLFAQVAVQLAVQAVAYGSMAFLLYPAPPGRRASRRRASERPARDAGLATAGPRLLGVPDGRGVPRSPVRPEPVTCGCALAFPAELRRRVGTGGASRSPSSPRGSWCQPVSRRTLSTASLIGSARANESRCRRQRRDRGGRKRCGRRWRSRAGGGDAGVDVVVGSRGVGDAEVALRARHQLHQALGSGGRLCAREVPPPRRR